MVVHTLAPLRELLLQPRIRDRLVCVPKTVLLTPSGIRSLRAFVELLVLVAEYEPDVDVRTLCFDQKVFLPVTSNETPFAFDIKKPPRGGDDLEVRCVLG